MAYLISVIEDAQIWPVTVSGWVALIAGIGAILGGLYAFFRLLTSLNGLGERVNELASKMIAISTKHEEIDKQMTFINAERTLLVRDTAEAKTTAKNTKEIVEALKLEIVQRLSDLREDMTTKHNELMTKVAVIESSLHHRD